MIFKIKGEELKIKYTFNSFKFMREFDIRMVDEVQFKPFLVIPVIEQLLLGGLNYSPTKTFSIVDIDEAVEAFADYGDIKQLMEDLIAELKDSPFFKSLQRGMEEVE